MVKTCCVAGCDGGSKQDKLFFKVGSIVKVVQFDGLNNPINITRVYRNKQITQIELAPKLPTSRTLRQRWLEVIKPTSKLSINSAVCSAHFSSDDYESVRGRTRLKRSIVPTIFDNMTQSSDIVCKKIKETHSKCDALNNKEHEVASAAPDDSSMSSDCENNEQNPCSKIPIPDKTIQKETLFDHSDQNSSNDKTVDHNTPNSIIDQNDNSKESQSPTDSVIPAHNEIKDSHASIHNEIKDSQASLHNEIKDSQTATNNEMKNSQIQEDEKTLKDNQIAKDSETLKDDQTPKDNQIAKDSEAPDDNETQNENEISIADKQIDTETPNVDETPKDNESLKHSETTKDSETVDDIQITKDEVSETIKDSHTAKDSKTTRDKETTKDCDNSNDSIIANINTGNTLRKLLKNKKGLRKTLRKGSPLDLLKTKVPTTTPDNTDDIEDLLTYYHIKQNKPINRKHPEPIDNRTAMNTQPETIDVEIDMNEPVFIEIPVDKDRNTDTTGDCMMLLESVQVDIDPAALMLPDREIEDYGEVDDRSTPDRKADPISLLTSSDEDDVIIEEPHIDTVEVSDETDEDDVPLVKLVKQKPKVKKMKNPTNHSDIQKFMWGAHDYFCVECHFKSMSRSAYKRHLSQQHSMILQMCEICGYTTSSKSQLVRHKKKHKEYKRFSCHLCDYKARHNMSLIYHLKTHDEINKKKSLSRFKCDRCMFCSNSKSKFMKHVKSCTKDRKYKCDKCIYVTKRGSDLKRHKTRMHREDADEEYVP